MSKGNEKNASHSDLNKLDEQKEVLGQFHPSAKRLKQITNASAKFLQNATEDQLMDFQEFTDFKCRI